MVHQVSRDSIWTERPFHPRRYCYHQVTRHLYVNITDIDRRIEKPHIANLDAGRNTKWLDQKGSCPQGGGGDRLSDHQMIVNVKGLTKTVGSSLFCLQAVCATVMDGIYFTQTRSR